MASQSELSLDSSFFVACDLTHRALKGGLTSVSDLSVTQFRALVKLVATAPSGMTQSELSELLGIKANVASQVVNALEAAGYAKRRKCANGDGRVRFVHITKAGTNLVERANTAIVEELYTLFPTQNKAYRSILEASIAAGANIDPPLSKEAAKRYFASRTLVSLELIRKAMEDALREACGASVSECIVLMKLGEARDPLRIGDLARQLQLTPVTVARATDRLVARSWAQRLASPADRKAVFVSPTAEGARAQRQIADAVDGVAETFLWSRLDESQSRALAEAGHVVLVDIQSREEAERKAALDLLEPIR
ncbi:MarR family transcriptional regulator [Raoultibacter phocaeensis]|uniref:MarR family transcriptional regulator n=1 Tax=Raoultibacter phocaeensis TaxID=2479841 RepID=UPI00111AC977|nr:MarR family transcriptional regulator [Raoultibacter phocaeensis]